MKCADTEQYIQLYIDNELSGAGLRDFIKHVENCPTCYEEMEISYLVKEALLRLEDGTTFDLRGELENKLAVSQKCLRIHEGIIIWSRLLLMAALAVLLLSAVAAVIRLGIIL